MTWAVGEKKSVRRDELRKKAWHKGTAVFE